MKIHIFEYHEVPAFRWLCLHGNFWTINLDTLIYTWIAMAMLFTCVLIGRHYTLKKNPTIFGMGIEETVGIFMNLVTESFGTFHYHYFIFIASLFFFTFFCCLVGIVPFLDEATKDLNTTLALALSSFCYVQWHKARVHGLKAYLLEFTQPFFLLTPINIVGELAKIVSMSFRLLGNILGGGVILAIILEIIGNYALWYLSGIALIACFALITKHLTSMSSKLTSLLFIITWIQLFFNVFEGAIQSFVLTMLTTTYLAIGTYTGQEEHSEEKPL